MLTIIALYYNNSFYCMIANGIGTRGRSEKVCIKQQ